MAKLERQLPVQHPNAQRGTGVIYNASGSWLRAARYNGGEVVESGCYWWNAGSEDEALYLVAMLNADVLQEVYRRTRASDRDYHLYLWDLVPIPCYDEKKEDHKRLADLSRIAEKIVDTSLHLVSTSTRQSAASKMLRRMLQEAGVAAKIDAIAAAIVK